MKVNKRLFKLFLIIFMMFSFINVYAEDDYNNLENNDGKNNTSVLSVNERINGNVILIEDDAGLLSSDEVLKLKNDMKNLTKYGNIAFKSISSNSSSTANYASDYYHEKFGSSSGSLFLIDMDNRKIYIFSDGNNYKYITNSKANIITDNIYTYASRKDYYNCASMAYSQMNTILSGGKIAEPMRYISNSLISLILSFLFCYLFVFFSSKIKKASMNEILRGCDISYKIDNVHAEKTGMDSKYDPISDSSSYSGGGSSSSGGGGGSSSGGGGGHSF